MVITKKPLGQLLRPLLAFAIALTMLPGSFHIHAADEDETEYIVKYREEAMSLMEEDDVPFDVVTKSELKRLLRDNAVEWFEEDGVAVLMDEEPEENPSVADTVYYNAEEQWNLSLINADSAFQKEYLGQGVRVGVIDSGVNPHDDLKDRLLEGQNYMNETSEDETKVNDTSDDYGHGTRVAGLIAAAGNDGYIGAAPGAEIVPLKCTDGKNVKISVICKAIYGGIDNYGCDVLNLSLGVRTEYQSLKDAVDYAAQKGVVLVAATGNTGKSEVYYPAGYDTVIGVGSIDSKGSLYYHSNHNSSIFLTAPGVDVRSTNKNGGYVLSTGCSFAVPQVSAAAAVMLGIDHTLEPDEIMEILSDTAVDRGVNGYDEDYGYGILNIGGCVGALTDSEDTQPEPTQPSDPTEPDDDNGRQEPGNDPDDMNLVDVSDPEDQPDPPDINPPEPTAEPDPQNPSVPTQPSDTPPSTDPVITPEPIANPDPQNPPVPTRPSDPPPATDPVITPEPTVKPDPQSPPDQEQTPQEEPSWIRCERDSNCVLNAFSDLDPSSWYHDGIHYVLVNSIMNGTSGKTFEPDGKTTRAMIVTMLWRLEGSPLVKENMSFKDVPENQWYTDAIRWAASKGIVNGYSKNEFGPADYVNREQLAAILWRYADYQGRDTGSGSEEDPLGRYTDTEQISSWAMNALKWSVSAGIIQGMDDTHLRPEKNSNRAQVATMLMRYGQ